MTLKKLAVTFALGSVVLLTTGATASTAQSHVNSPDPLLGAPSVATETSNINGITGHAESGKHLYRRFCIGCHGPDGNGQGMNAQWIDPQPRDFTERIALKSLQFVFRNRQDAGIDRVANFDGHGR